MAITVVEYVREDDSSPYRAWFDALDPQAAATACPKAKAKAQERKMRWR